ncbi:Putative ribonuclease H protein At1g65750 [Linum perenne]
MLWKIRNERIFVGAAQNPLSAALRSVSWSKQVVEAMDRTRASLGIGTSRRIEEVQWDPGPAGWVTLNVDGSVNGRVGKATAGGLLRNSEGRCLFAFTMNIGTCSIMHAEMRGAIEGLHRTWEARHRSVVLKMDSRAAIALLSNGDTTSNQHAMETMQFQEFMGRDWRLRIEHTYREGNQAADFLAGIGYGYLVGSHNVDLSDSRLGYFL